MSKRVTAEQLVASAWAAALLPNNEDEVPLGWFTSHQIGEALGKSSDTASGQLSRAVREGRAEVRRFRVMTSRGIYPVPHYRLTK